MDIFIASKFFFVTLTLLIYLLAQHVYRRWKIAALHPVPVTTLTLILVLKMSGIAYQDYARSGDLISFFLGPAVVALGVPLYLQSATIKKQGKTLLVAVLAGSITGIVSAAGIATLFRASAAIIISLAPKSVTTPIAMGIAEKLGGIPALTAAMVVLTGMFGAIVGPAFLKLIGVVSPTAVGLAIGCAAHGLGTSRAIEAGEVQGAFSSLGLCLNGLVTAILTPLLLQLFL